MRFHNVLERDLLPVTACLIYDTWNDVTTVTGRDDARSSSLRDRETLHDWRYGRRVPSAGTHARLLSGDGFRATPEYDEALHAQLTRGRETPFHIELVQPFSYGTELPY